LHSFSVEFFLIGFRLLDFPDAKIEKLKKDLLEARDLAANAKKSVRQSRGINAVLRRQTSISKGPSGGGSLPGSPGKHGKSVEQEVEFVEISSGELAQQR
jgi:hypothetical protein